VEETEARWNRWTRLRKLLNKKWRGRHLNKSVGRGIFQKIHPKTLASKAKKIHPDSHLNEPTYTRFDQHTPQKSISMFDATEEYASSGTFPTERNSWK
jgi:hypothetical protein